MSPELMFPVTWSEQRVLAEIELAAKSVPSAAPNKFFADNITNPSGVTIRIGKNDKGVVVQAYPVKGN